MKKPKRNGNFLKLKIKKKKPRPSSTTLKLEDKKINVHCTL